METLSDLKGKVVEAFKAPVFPMSRWGDNELVDWIGHMRWEGVRLTVGAALKTTASVFAANYLVQTSNLSDRDKLITFFTSSILISLSGCLSAAESLDATQEWEEVFQNELDFRENDIDTFRRRNFKILGSNH